MRLPNSKKMSPEQKNIYFDAPSDGAILVTGPPGTGKTVIAFLRAQALSKEGKDVVVAMYNRVLSRYAGNVNEDLDENLGIRTIHSWIYSWWKQLNLTEIKTYGKGASSDSIDKKKVYINCPFDEKDEAKGLGAKWDRNKKTWFVPSEKFKENASDFSKWMKPKKKKMGLPKMDGSQFDPDWDEILRIILHNLNKQSLDLSTINWGHLIIDEAQDFPVAMFKVLGAIMTFFPEKPVDNNPALTVFADENQRLQENTNSTISDIRNNLYILEDREFSLTENHRNTLQIAKLAAEFYAGLRTGIPELPSREGDVPKLVKCDRINDAVEHIYNHAHNHDNEEIGVIVTNNKIREKFVNRLKSKIDKNKKKFTLQSYAHNDQKYKDTDKLEFGKGGVITVINKHSCKGLEFDAVFLPEIQSVSVDPSDRDQFMMDMYVMISRAKHSLALMYTNKGDEDPAILSYLPKEGSGLLEYINAR